MPGNRPRRLRLLRLLQSSAHESRLLVPEIVVGLRDGQAWLTQLTFDDGDLTEAGARAALDRWLGRATDGGSTINTISATPDGGSTIGAGVAAVDRTAPGAAEAGAAVVRPLPLAAGATLHTGSLSEEGWMAAVAAGVQEIRTGALEKLVLARDVVATVPTGVNAAQVLRELSAQVPRMLDLRGGRPGGRHAGDADPGGGPHCAPASWPARWTAATPRAWRAPHWNSPSACWQAPRSSGTNTTLPSSH